jgi:hypothetical protein
MGIKFNYQILIEEVMVRDTQAAINLHLIRLYLFIND